MRLLSLLLVVLFVPAFCQTPTEAYIRWNRLALQMIEANQTPSQQATRNLTLLNTAIFDAQNTVYQQDPFLFSTTLQSEASSDAAINAAAHGVMTGLYPQNARLFDDELTDALGYIPDSDSKDEGIRIGGAIANQANAWPSTP